MCFAGADSAGAAGTCFLRLFCVFSAFFCVFFAFFCVFSACHPRVDRVELGPKNLTVCSNCLLLFCSFLSFLLS